MTSLADALTAALIHSLWQDAVVATLVYVALPFLRHRTAAERYATLCAAMAVLVALPIITAAIVYVPGSRPSVVLAGVAHAAPGDDARYGTEFAPMVSEAALAASVNRWLLPCWLVGVLICSVRLAGSSILVRSLKRHREPPDDALVSLVATLARRLGVTRTVRVCVCAVGAGPATLGTLRPIILLPPAAAMGISPRQLEAILAHELAHIRRHDYLVNLVQVVVETLFFYHPAVWWVSARIRVEREFSCDDAAVESCGDALCYARALTAVARSAAAPTFAMAATGGSLVPRIRRLVYPPSPCSTSRFPAILIVALMLAIGTLTPGWVRAQVEAGLKPAPGTATLSGVVFDPLGEAAANVPLTLDNSVIGQGGDGPSGPPIAIEGLTDSAGRFRFKNVPAGEYVLAPAITWVRTTNVRLAPDASVERDVRMEFDTIVTGLVMVLGGKAPTEQVQEPARQPRAAGPVQGPQHLHSWNRPYPQSLFRRLMSGTVVLEGTLGVDGVATDVRIVESERPELTLVALEAIQEERWEPARVRGVPVEVPLRVILSYRPEP